MGADHNTAALTPSFTALADLASARVGGRALAANDDSSRRSRTSLNAGSPRFSFPASSPRAASGWTAGRRGGGALRATTGASSRSACAASSAASTSTRSHFTGNYPSHCSIDAIDSARTPTPAVCAAEGAPWVTLVPKSPLRGNSDNFLPVVDVRPWTHVRLEHLSRRRRRAAARLRRGGGGLAAHRPRTPRHRSRVHHATAGWSSARATCTSAPRTT